MGCSDKDGLMRVPFYFLTKSKDSLMTDRVRDAGVTQPQVTTYVDSSVLVRGLRTRALFERGSPSRARGIAGRASAHVFEVCVG